MSDRIPCFVPGCKRTAPKDKYPNTEEIICGKCWKLVPQRFRNRHKVLRKRERQLIRAWSRKGVENPAIPVLWRQVDQNWEAIRNSFSREKPRGLEAFMAEIGIGVAA